MNRKTIKYIPVILLSVVIISGLFFTLTASGDNNVIEVDLGTIGAENITLTGSGINIVDATLESNSITITHDKKVKKVVVSLNSNATANWINPTWLKIKLGDTWEALGSSDSSLELVVDSPAKSITPKLKYEMNNHSTLPPPGTHKINLSFGLVSASSCSICLTTLNDAGQGDFEAIDGVSENQASSLAGADLTPSGCRVNKLENEVRQVVKGNPGGNFGQVVVSHFCPDLYW